MRNGYVVSVTSDGMKGRIYELGGTGVNGLFKTGDSNGAPLAREAQVTFDLDGDVAINIVATGDFCVSPKQRAEASEAASHGLAFFGNGFDNGNQ
jgi:hypothetical protein